MHGLAVFVVLKSNFRKLPEISTFQPFQISETVNLRWDKKIARAIWLVLKELAILRI